MAQNTKNSNDDLYGQALLDFCVGNHKADILVYSSFNEEDILPLPYMFRSNDQMPQLEQKALELCKGRVLDIGCGAGGHALHLQGKGIGVVALDRSPGAIEVCQKRGVQRAVHGEVLDFSGQQFDTLLLMMNGIGIAGRLKDLPKYLRHFRSLLAPGGQILLDSSDIIYMFDKDDDGGHWVPGHLGYYGEVRFQMEYNGQKGPVFDWLYIDFATLKTYGEDEGFLCELIAEGEHYDYLAKLSLA